MKLFELLKQTIKQCPFQLNTDSSDLNESLAYYRNVQRLKLKSLCSGDESCNKKMSKRPRLDLKQENPQIQQRQQRQQPLGYSLKLRIKVSEVNQVAISKTNSSIISKGSKKSSILNSSISILNSSIKSLKKQRKLVKLGLNSLKQKKPKYLKKNNRSTKSRSNIVVC